MRRMVYDADKVTPEDEQRLEKLAFQIASSYPDIDIWFFSNETEGKSPLLKAKKFDEWAKIQYAIRRGIKRATPDAKIMPDCGTSGFNPLRGYDVIEGYLKASKKDDRWEIIAVHPYGSIDGTRGTSDLDIDAQYLVNIMKKYGYNDTSIFFTEGFLETSLNIH